MMYEPANFGAVQLDLKDFIRIREPAIRGNRIAWIVVFGEDPATAVRSRDVKSHAPIGCPNTGLLAIGKTDFHDVNYASVALDLYTDSSKSTYFQLKGEHNDSSGTWTASLSFNFGITDPARWLDRLLGAK